MSKLSDWLAKGGVRSGEWYAEAKAFAKIAMRAADLSADAFQVLICLRLHTMPYQSNLAVTMHSGKRRSLTPSHICEETGLSRQNVRRALVELEEAGFALRKAIGEGGLHKGNVEIYCWIVPRSVSEKPKVVARDYNLSPKIVALVRLFRIPLPDDFVASPAYNAFVEEAAADYKQAKIVAASACKEAFFVAPGAPAYKDERKYLKESTERENHSSSSAFASGRRKGDSGTAKAEEGESRLLYQTFKAEYPASHFDEPKTKPAFEKEMVDQQRVVIERLRVYLACERWQADGGRWVPFSSKWLQTYEAEPPPALRKTRPARVGDSESRLTDVLQGFHEREEQRKAAREKS